MGAKKKNKSDLTIKAADYSSKDIQKGAFNKNNGRRVPLLKEHSDHTLADHEVIGTARLECTDKGVTLHCKIRRDRFTDKEVKDILKRACTVGIFAANDTIERSEPGNRIVGGKITHACIDY